MKKSPVAYKGGNINPDRQNIFGVWVDIYKTEIYGAGFLNRSTTDILGQVIFSSCGGGPVH